MRYKHILIGIFSLFVLAAGTLFVSSNALAQNLTVHSIFINPAGANETVANVTTKILEGTPEEITSQYYKLGEEFDKKAGIKSGDSVTYIYKNNSQITIPYIGEYKTPPAEELLEDVFIPLGEEGDALCWITVERDGKVISQTHSVC